MQLGCLPFPLMSPAAYLTSTENRSGTPMGLNLATRCHASLLCRHAGQDTSTIQNCWFRWGEPWKESRFLMADLLSPEYDPIVECML